MLSLLLLPLIASPSVAQDSLSFRRLSGDGEIRQPLPVGEAFPYFVSVESDDRYRLDFQVAPEHYLYLHGFKVSYIADDAAQPRELTLKIPDGIAYHDQFFGDVQVYYDSVSLLVDLGDLQTNGGSLLIEYQGCADWGLCYPPQKDQFPLL